MPPAPLQKTLLVLLPLALAACSHTVAVGASRTVTIALTEYRLSPRNLQAAPGRLTIVASNHGREVHNLVVSQNGRGAGSTPPIWPGRSASLTVDLTKGTYTIASTLFSDQDLGEYGTLTVR